MRACRITFLTLQGRTTSHFFEPQSFSAACSNKGRNQTLKHLWACWFTQSVSVAPLNNYELAGALWLYKKETHLLCWKEL